MSEIKVFKINDYDWYAATSLEEAIACSMEYSGLTLEEAYDKDVARECDPEDWMWDCEPSELGGLTEEEKQKHKITFREFIQRCKDNGEEFPCAVASTEY